MMNEAWAESIYNRTIINSIFFLRIINDESNEQSIKPTNEQYIGFKMINNKLKMVVVKSCVYYIDKGKINIEKKVKIDKKDWRKWMNEGWKEKKIKHSLYIYNRGIKWYKKKNR